ncbi:MAG: alpha/beta hydrolase family protein [Polyangiales bacterium]
MYLHGGFALGRGDLDDCDGARKAGFAVFLPSLRGENGNPGDFEYGFGELDDALAAIRFAAALPGIDPKRVVVFGHSMGGMLSALTSLFQDLPAVATGSAGGLFDERLFGATPIPFADSPMERRLRLFAPFAEQLKKPHFACAGRDDQMPLEVSAAVERRIAGKNLPFVRQIVAGNHLTSASTCMDAFIALVAPNLH